MEADGLRLALGDCDALGDKLPLGLNDADSIANCLTAIPT